MKYDYATNSHYLTHKFLFKRLGEFTYVNLGVKGLYFHDSSATFI